ncbi:MAG: cell division control protein Cdc6 [Euryarchaeota archaeon]|nr:cell division control protein Cdc6 [Euryarchaeota archaeon]
MFDSLSHDERIFKNREALSSTYIPKHFPHREEEIGNIANILKPALNGSRPSNILIYGQTGTGKTAVAKFICDQITAKAKNDDKKIHTAYINCKQTNTTYSILSNIGKAYSKEWEEEIPIAGWRIDKVYAEVKQKAKENGGIVILVLDEIDALVTKAGDDILYHLTSLNSDLENSKISIIGISNDVKFTSWLDPRVKSRLGEESLAFAPYNAPQIEEILYERSKIAFKENVVEPLVVSYCSSKAAQEHGDVRKALDLLRISAELADREEREIVTARYVNLAQNVMENDQVKNIISTLPIQNKATFASIIVNQGSRKNGQQTTGEVYETYSRICNIFKLEILTQRRISNLISELDMQGLIHAKTVSLGRQGRTKYISLAIEENQLKVVMKNDSFFADILEELEKSNTFTGSMQLRLI